MQTNNNKLNQTNNKTNKQNPRKNNKPKTKSKFSRICINNLGNRNQIYKIVSRLLFFFHLKKNKF